MEDALKTIAANGLSLSFRHIDIFATILSLMATTKDTYYIITDGVDECSDPEDLVVSFARLVNVGAKIMAFSRPYPNIMNGIRRMETGISEISINDDRSQSSDIRAFIQHHLSSEPHLQALLPEIKERLASVLEERASHM